MSTKYVIIGGGIAGVCCAQELLRLGELDVTIVSASDTLIEVRSLNDILLLSTVPQDIQSLYFLNYR
jgi:2-polyprenyl-6-methoxyphenol hydroxylase-like FAD-dependent oxidoreductase